MDLTARVMQNLSVLASVLLAQLIFITLLLANPALAQVTLLIPARPDINKTQPKKAQAKTQATKDEAGIREETDILITRMHAFSNECFSMDTPQSFTVLLYRRTEPIVDGHPKPLRGDLLGDVEEILYKGKKAWGANVALTSPGLYHFLLETKPWWNDAQTCFMQHFVKVMLPVFGDDTGWDEQSGQRFEIVPQTRPFGLLAPALFQGTVLFEGKAQPNCLVILERINTDNQKVPTPWHESQVFKTNANGQFTAVLNRSGWWCARALREGPPLKGADGQPKAFTMGALYWFFVDSENFQSR
ncbi:MAG: DUF4198 domain-containing protein [Desulfovibrionaceae bacterium]|nr:DUF4198 domain-containing protein [Desulfovibrionaceae bacterium]